MKWEYRSLQNIIEKPISGEWGDGEGETNVIRTTNFTNDGSLDLSDVVQRNIPLKKIEQKKLEFGDTIIEKSGGSPNQPVGRVVYFDQKEATFLCNNFTSVIRAKSEIDKRYLFWFLFSNHLNQNTLRYQNKTTGIINLQLERYITDLQIPLPPLATQKRIAAILDAADALRRKDQTLLQKYDELAQAIFVDMFGDPVKNEKGWEVKKLNDLCVTITDGTHQSPTFQKSGIPFLFVSNIRNNKIDYNTQTFISELDYGILAKRTPIEVGNILLTTVGATYGNPAIIEDERKFTFQRHIAFMKPKHDLVNYRYLFGILKDAYVKRQIDQRVNGAAQKTLNLSDLKEIKIWLPPRSLQDVYAKKLDIINRLKLICNAKTSETLFQSLLQKAFNAELVP